MKRAPKKVVEAVLDPNAVKFPWRGGWLALVPGQPKHYYAGLEGMTRVALTGRVGFVEEKGRNKRRHFLKQPYEVREGVYIPRGRYDGPLLRAIRARTHNFKGELQR